LALSTFHNLKVVGLNPTCVIKYLTIKYYHLFNDFPVD
jgi:hypothetical protein